MVYSPDVFHDGVKDFCEVCSSQRYELRSFHWGRVEITACEKCFKNIKNRINFGLKEQHAFHESESLQQKRGLTV